MSAMESQRENFSEFACIGSGFSAIGLGATLKRWYDIEDIQFFERNAELGGTWYNNRYPGTQLIMTKQIVEAPDIFNKP